VGYGFWFRRLFPVDYAPIAEIISLPFHAHFAIMAWAENIFVQLEKHRRISTQNDLGNVGTSWRLHAAQ
jgi:hypothetical protein